MKPTQSFNSYIENSIKDNWDRDALTDYKGATLQYHDVARKIAKLHIIFRHSGLQPGDKVALCGRNSSAWAAAFLATITYGAVAVPIQHEFTPDMVYNIVNHSESRLLFVGDVVSPTIDAGEMPALEGIIYIPDFSLTMSRSETLTFAREHLNKLFGEEYPKAFERSHVSYHQDSPEELALINYTSGTTGFSKGVMLPYRALWSNLDFTMRSLGANMPPGSNVLCTLPMAHMYGMMVEFFLNFCLGNHLFFLTRLPSPSLIQSACADIHPAVVIVVPMVIEKIIRKMVFPLIQQRYVHLLLNMPVVNKKIKARILQQVKDIFGGQLFEMMFGGAGLNREVEDFLRHIGFPLAVGYGTTETAPLITYSDYRDFVRGTCGRVVDNMEIRIASPDPANVPGEILTRGTNVMLGYYKNTEASHAVLDKDGWFHTGDLATIDGEGHVFIRGRIKNMLLSANGQNIYPEEIENKLNSMMMVNESVIIQRDNKFVGLVHPDMDAAKQLGFSIGDLGDVMEENRKQLNSLLPAFCKVSAIQIHEQEFEKTPKKSIKRYLYQNA